MKKVVWGRALENREKEICFVVKGIRTLVSVVGKGAVVGRPYLQGKRDPEINNNILGGEISIRDNEKGATTAQRGSNDRKRPAGQRRLLEKEGHVLRFKKEIPTAAERLQKEPVYF